MKNKKPFKNEIHIREVSAEIDKESIDVENRTFEFSFSSEAPILRYIGGELAYEILDHSRGSADLERINQGGAYLEQHDPDKMRGVVEKAWLVEDQRKLRSRVKMSRSVAAEEIWQDIQDGIRKNVSFRYELNEAPKSEKTKDGAQAWRYYNWSVLEVSTVSIPADFSVGVGRNHEPVKKVNTMTPEEKAAYEEAARIKLEAAVEKARTEARAETTTSLEAEFRAKQKRVTEIRGLGDQFKRQDLAKQFLDSGKSVEEFKTALLDEVKAEPQQIEIGDTDIGLSPKEIKNYSVMDAIRMQVNGVGVSEESKGLILECSKAVESRAGKSPHGIFVPNDVQTAKRPRRDLTVGSDPAGGYLVETQLVSFIDLLRNMLITENLGATVLDGLVGDVAIPKQTASGTGYWLNENGQITESQQTLGQVTLTPKTVGAFTDISRKLMQQSSIDVESFVQQDLSKVLAIAIDLAALYGIGASGQPLGIANTTGIGSDSWTSTSAPTWAEIVGLESLVAVDNALMGSLAYLSAATMRGTLKSTSKDTGSGQFIWDADEMNGYGAALSNQVSSDDVFFGDWSSLLMGMWGTLDILVDNTTLGTTGAVRVRVMKDVDIAVRHAESFALGSD